MITDYGLRVADYFYTPKGLHIVAQGQRSATLGGGDMKAHTLKGLHNRRPNPIEGSMQPLYVWD